MTKKEKRKKERKKERKTERKTPKTPIRMKQSVKDLGFNQCEVVKH